MRQIRSGYPCRLRAKGRHTQSHCQEYTDSKGNRVTRAELSKLQQELWDAQRKLQNRMAKAAGAAGRGKTTAASNRGSFASYQHAEPTIRLY